jgi:ubiquinone/menaquinone biosynthesis C-methylase UbiE
MIVYNEGDLSSNYPAARALSAETSATWSDVLRPFLARYYRPTVLDLGCGTGRFSMLIAQRPRATVIGVDPSIAMLRKALGAAETGNICYAVAEAERLPLAASSCDIVWVSQVVHHIRDRRACATELHRVLRPNGVVLIRGTFGDRLDGFPALFRFFPSSRELTARFPTILEIVEVFESEGFSLEGCQRVRQQTCRSLREFAERTKLRADSTLVRLPDSEFEACQKSLEEAARSEEIPSPVVETIELLCLRWS